MDEGTMKTQNPKCRLDWCLIVYRLEIQSVMLVFSTPLVNCCPSTFSLISSTPPPLPKVNIHYLQTVFGCGGGGALSCVVDHTYSVGILHSVSDQIQNPQNCFTTPKQKHQ
jgi:hypothetical protein